MCAVKVSCCATLLSSFHFTLNIALPFSVYAPLAFIFMQSIIMRGGPAAILLKKGGSNHLLGTGGGGGGGLDPPGSTPDMGGQKLKVICKLLTCSN